MTKKSIVPEARVALNQFKVEIAKELGINPTSNLTAHTTSRQAGLQGGKLGGEMTKRLIENATKSLGNSKDIF